MALGARTEGMRDALNRLAIRFALLAAAREISAETVQDSSRTDRS
jgi:hypothetical protein